MSAADMIASLDRMLAERGEDIWLRRRVGEGANAQYTQVRCRARVDAVNSDQAPAGTRVAAFNIIMSPTQINDAGWPGGAIPALPPFNVDPRIPRENSTDDVILRGAPRAIKFSDPKVIDGELVRINLRVEA